MATTIISRNDSMNTIQTKLNKGGTVRFSTAVYKITKQLVIPKNTVVDLNGSTLQRKASIQSVFINKVTKNTLGYSGDGKIIIINGTIEGMGGYSYDNLVTFFHSHDIKIYNCTFQDILCHAVELNSTTDVEIYNCKFLGYNLKDIDHSHKECIQIDFAYYAGFTLSGSTKNSRCYDSTCCKNINIHDNVFTKSNYRDYPYACIGGHNQPTYQHKHENIKIYNNDFHCKINPDLKQPCLSIIAMNKVQVYDNKFECSRVARIYSKDCSYSGGLKIKAVDGDGICNNVRIVNNEISGCTSKGAFHQYNKSGSTNHSEIVKKPNEYI